VATAPRPIVGHIAGFRARVAECNEITPEDIASYVPLVIAGVPVGLMQARACTFLRLHNVIFCSQAKTPIETASVVCPCNQSKDTREWRQP
jgi:hypothetical protein